MEKLILIDGNSLLFRSYFAMRPMVTSSGIHTQGIYAFVNILTKIIKDYSPDYIGVAFDVKEKTFRHKEYAEYKDGRKPTPIELLSEIPYLKNILKAMNIAVFEMPGYEADDIIGTISAMASKNGMKTLVISGDKDELQLVNENVNVLINRKGMSEFEIYDIEKMKERYNLTPSQFIDLKGLMGDTSDNIPGIPGVGEKKGIALLEQYENVEGVIEHADEIKGKLGENVRNNIESAKLSKWLATIKLDVPLEFEWEDLKCREANKADLISIYKELEFNSFIKRLQSVDIETAEIASAENPFEEVFSKLKKQDVHTLISSCAEKDTLVIEIFGDNNHKAEPVVDGVALLNPKTLTYAVESLSLIELMQLVDKLISLDIELIGYDAKPFAYQLLYLTDSEIAFSDDVNIAEYLIYPNQSKYSISSMLLKYFSYVAAADEDDYVSDKNELKFSEIDDNKLSHRLYYIYGISQKQREVLNKEGLISLYEDCEMPLLNTLASMEREGISLDEKALGNIGMELDLLISNLESKILEATGENFNINSPKQLGHVLFEKLELPYPKKKGKTSSYSTAADILEKLADEYSIVNDVLEYRKYCKLRSTYVDGLLSLVAEDGKIRPHFMQTVAATGRLSCIEPNLQNIPIRDEYGRMIRRAFIAGEDNIFTGADYSQIELRVLAALSEDMALIKDFNEGNDIHKMTAHRVFNIPLEEVTPLDRTRAKAVNFGVIYGMSSHGLSENLGISRFEAQKYIDDYFIKHPEVSEFMDRMIKEGEEKREVRTYFGRIRQIPMFESRKFMDRELAKRLAMNTPIQGTAADIIKIAMNKVHDALNKGNFESKLILQIHDELIIEGPVFELEDVKALLKDCMESAVEFSIKLTVDIHSANSWYDLK